LSIGERDLDADEQAVAAVALVSKSLNEPVYEELTVAQIAERTGVDEGRVERVLEKFESFDMVRRVSDVRTREEVWSAVPPGVVHVGLRGPGTAGVASGRPKAG
jgi:hypothetical protein